MKLIYLYLSGFLLLLNCTSPKNTTQIVNLHPAPIDSVTIERGFTHYRAHPVKNNGFSEAIKKYPDNFKIQAVYQLVNFHKHYGIAQSNLSDSLKRERLIKGFEAEEINYFESVYKNFPYDCTVSSCIIKDEKGNEFFVFDNNNDEDFTNDPILKFQKSIKVEDSDSIYISSVKGNVKFEYFDGSKVTNKTIVLIFEREHKKTSTRDYWKFDTLLGGSIDLDGKKYNLVLNSILPAYGVYRYDFIRIDLDQDGKYDFFKNDYSQQMFLPFTFNKISYKITKIDPFGNYIKIKKCNSQKILPIAVDLPAPDFTATTLDSSKINLHDYRGHYVLLGFWSCNSMHCLNQIGELLDYSNKGLHIINFPFFKEFKRFLNEENAKTVDKLIVINEYNSSPVKKRYQIGSENAYILIDKQGKIVLIEKRTNKKLKQKLEEIFGKQLSDL